jgi:hypothetical protein
MGGRNYFLIIKTLALLRSKWSAKIRKLFAKSANSIGVADSNISFWIWLSLRQ